MARVELDIEDLSHDGRGVGRVAGKAVFVDGALPGEHVQALITKNGRSFDEAKLHKMLQASELRVKPACEYFSRCGGCDLQHMQPDAQLAFKQQHLLRQLAKAGIEPAEQLPSLHSKPWHYRSRARLAWDPRTSTLGFRQKAAKEVIAISHCPVLDDSLSLLIQPLAGVLSKLRKTQGIGHIELLLDKNGPFVHIHLAGQGLDPEARASLDQWADHSSVRLGYSDSYRLLEADVAGSRLQFTPDSFMQANSELNTAMVQQGIELLQPTDQDQVLELFCGVGNFSLPLARSVAHIVGIEGQESSVQQAKANSTLNQLNNTEFRVLDLFDADSVARLLKLSKANKLLLDPPRAGAEQVVKSIKNKQFERIVYISCNPATLVRDIVTLCRDKKYRLHSVGVMDMFPQTAHVESMAVLLPA